MDKFVSSDFLGSEIALPVFSPDSLGAIVNALEDGFGAGGLYGRLAGGGEAIEGSWAGTNMGDITIDEYLYMSKD